MINNGTKKAGMRTSGSWAIGAVVMPPANPKIKPELSTPVLTATTRSKMPKRFQTRNS